MISESKLEARAKELGATFFGIANLEPAQEEILKQGGPIIAGFPIAISIGIALPRAIVDHLDRQDDRVVVMNYQHHGYNIINPRLDNIASFLTGLLQSEGYYALPIPASQTLDSENHLGALSHKLAAHLAGLGWIGKSCLLVTPEVGPRVRWATVLTDAPFEPTGQAIEERCGNCRECVEICPPKAFTGKNFRPEEHRDIRFNVHKCKNYQDQLMKETGANLCGLCLYICPHGRKKR